MNENEGKVVWFTGLSGAGKSTLCEALAPELRSRGCRVHVLDADDVRRGLCSDLGFSLQDRTENVRRIAYVAEMIARSNTIVLVAVITPLESLREMVREIVSKMIEVFVDTPLSICEQRDPKGLYKRARAGELEDFTGIDSPFEAPSVPDVICQTNQEPLTISLEKLISRILGKDDQPASLASRR